SGNRQNGKKPDGKCGGALDSQPTKPTKGAFDAFVGDRSQARAGFLPDTLDRPRLGSFARPMSVRGTRMPATDCLWSTCDGSMTAHRNSRYLCSICATWFELLPPEDPGVYVGDLARLAESSGDSYEAMRAGAGAGP